MPLPGNHDEHLMFALLLGSHRGHFNFVADPQG